ncbi:MAG: low molecular weight phosphotyrosine protein phosphatase [Bacteroidales bacterium]|nr:low molecular weight phosphotyrosine protein phosphatase [Bacteroidales bacterium]
MKILFVCLGNICRSPLAEGVMKKMCAERGLDWEIDSAGLIDYHKGELPDPRMMTTAERHGYKLTHRSRPVKTADFEKFDYIIGMSDYINTRIVRDAPHVPFHAKIKNVAEFFVETEDYDEVPDPYCGTMRDFEIAVQLIEDACKGILKELS